MANITILQTNIISLNKNKDELERILKAQNITAACIMETWLDSETQKKSKITNYNLIANNRADGYGGTAIYIRKDIKYRTKNRFTYDNDIQITEILLIENKLTIIAMHAAPTTNITKFKTVIEQILNDPNTSTKTFIATDLNCHHTAWGNPYNDVKGKFLIEEIEETKFILLHRNETTFIPTDLSKRCTAIDLTIISEDIMNKCEREVLEHHMGATNHKTIITKIQEKTNNRKIKIINKHKIMKEIKDLKIFQDSTSTEICKKIKTIV